MPNENKSETYFRVLNCPGICSSPVMVYTHGSFLEKEANSIMVGTKGKLGRYTSVIKNILYGTSGTSINQKTIYLVHIYIQGDMGRDKALERFLGWI